VPPLDDPGHISIQQLSESGFIVVHIRQENPIDATLRCHAAHTLAVVTSPFATGYTESFVNQAPLLDVTR
jgi:hypothetical protein